MIYSANTRTGPHALEKELTNQNVIWEQGIAMFVSMEPGNNIEEYEQYISTKLKTQQSARCSKPLWKLCHLLIG